jgi:hypothetical protein
MALKSLFSIVLCLCLYHCAHAQTKYEKEYRLNQSQVPIRALEFVEQLPFDKKIKWFREEGLDKSSIEAKTKYLSKKYSIEFSADGEIEDVEIQIETDEIPSDSYEEMLKHLKTTYQKFKFCKVQLQLTGSSDSIINAVIHQDLKSTQQVTVNYEVVLKVKRDNKHEQIETLFNNQGEQVNTAVIVPKNSDNLEY